MYHAVCFEGDDPEEVIERVNAFFKKMGRFIKLHFVGDSNTQVDMRRGGANFVMYFIYEDI